MRWLVVLLNFWSLPLKAEGLPSSYVLVSMAGADKVPHATLDFGEDGSVAGQAPCNRWFAQVQGAAPAFALGPIATTRMGCADMGPEDAFLDLLSQVAAMERQAGQLTLFDANGVVVLVFNAAAG